MILMNTSQPTRHGRSWVVGRTGAKTRSSLIGINFILFKNLNAVFTFISMQWWIN